MRRAVVVELLKAHAVWCDLWAGEPWCSCGRLDATALIEWHVARAARQAQLAEDTPPGVDSSDVLDELVGAGAGPRVGGELE